jgi:hypothetical protein
MDLGEIGLQPPPEFATPTATRATLFGLPGRERIWQVNGQKGTERSNYVYMPAPRAFRANARGTKYREANDPGDRNLARESEIRQRGGWGWDCFLLLGDFGFARVYVVDAPRHSIRQQTVLERRISFTLARQDSK